jgi:hypothetical protein
MKKILFSLAVIFTLTSCDPKMLEDLATTILTDTTKLTDAQIGSGLKEALTIGIGNGVDVLSAKDGYYKSAYKILLPPEARQVTDQLKRIPGFTEVEDILLEKINRGAEDAATRAKPIFVSAIKEMTFTDAKNILMGQNNAATQYLNLKTGDKLYKEFNPVIVNSLDKFQARKYWRDAVTAYNKLPFITKVNPSLDDYITKQALNGLFDMVEKKETKIRADVRERTSDLLKRVFSLQDNK